MFTIKQGQQLVQLGNYTYSIYLKKTYLHLSIFKREHHLLCFDWQNRPWWWKVLQFELASAPAVFTLLTKPIVFLCQFKSSHIIIHLDGIPVMICSKHMGKRTLLYLRPNIYFSKSEFYSHSILFCGTVFGYSGHVFIFTIWQTT